MYMRKLFFLGSFVMLNTAWAQGAENADSMLEEVSVVEKTDDHTAENKIDQHLDEAQTIVSTEKSKIKKPNLSTFMGHESLYLMQGAWSITNYNEVSDDLDIDLDSSSSTYKFNFVYLAHLGNDIWLGPYLGFSRTSKTVDGDSEASYDWRPGLEFRKFISTKGNGYFSIFGRAGWLFGGESADASDGQITSSVNGFNYGGGLSIGNEIGERDPYIVETVIEFSGGSFSGDISQGAVEVDYRLKASQFYFGLALGKLF